jgi:hypothetical protein
MSYSDLLQERAGSRRTDRRHQLQLERIEAERASLVGAERRIQQKRDARIGNLHALKEAQRVEESKAERAAEIRSSERRLQQAQSQEAEASRSASARLALQSRAAIENPPPQEEPEHARTFPSPPAKQLAQPHAVYSERLDARSPSPTARRLVEKQLALQNEKLTTREKEPSGEQPRSIKAKDTLSPDASAGSARRKLPDEPPVETRADAARNERSPVQTAETQTRRMVPTKVEEPKKRVVRREQEPPQLPNVQARSHREESPLATKLRRKSDEQIEEQPASASRVRSARLVEAEAENLIESSSKPPPDNTLLESEAAASTPEETASDQAPEPSSLKTRGRFIVDAFCNSVMLRGATVAGLDTLAPAGNQAFRDVLALDDPNLSSLIGLWGANLVRLPFQANTFLTGNADLSADALLSGLDETIAAVNDAGAWVLLALDTLNASNPVQTQDMLRIWQLLANRYLENPGVLYELMAPPSVSAADWQQLALALVGSIRKENPAATIFVASGNAGINVNGLPFRFSTGEPVFNLVYVIDFSSGDCSESDCRQLEAFANSFPVFASNWREDEADFGRLSGFAACLLDRYGIGWAASGWNTAPRLVADAEHHNFTPTSWGLTVQRAMKLPSAPLLKSFRPFLSNAETMSR